MNVKVGKVQSRSKPAPTSRVAARKLDAFPDRIDLRDWPYQLTLAPLHDELDNRRLVPEILDQGMEGACIGLALAGVVNFLLARRSMPRQSAHAL